MTGDSDTRRLLAVFVDGLRPDSIDRMPFVRAMGNTRRLTTELGYSVTCHASMYTGVRPDRHRLWFVWIRDPDGSPFRNLTWLRRLHKVDSIPLRIIVQRLLRWGGWLASGGFFGVPRIVNLGMRWWDRLNVAEDRLWWEPGYLPHVPTIFEILEQHKQQWMFLKPPFETLATATLGYPDPSDDRSMAYLFVGDVDAVSHAHGQDSEQAGEVLQRLDRSVAQAYGELTRRDGHEPMLLLWSDHGHAPTTRIDAYRLARGVGVDLNSMLHVVDANFVRIWHDDRAVLERTSRRLETLTVGRLLDEETLRHFRCPVGERRWGDIIFYLDLPYVFSRTIWGFSRHMRSAHGYMPTHPESDGVVVSNVALADTPAHIVDIAPTLLELAGVPSPRGLDGISLVRDHGPATGT